MDFYDSLGNPIAFADNNNNIYLFSGRPVGYIHDDAVYMYSGKQLGWFENGWIYDIQGHAVFFTSSAQGGPLRPMRRLSPPKGLRNLSPLKSIRQLKKLKPIRSLSWSLLSGEQFFQ